MKDIISLPIYTLLAERTTYNTSTGYYDYPLNMIEIKGSESQVSYILCC